MKPIWTILITAVATAAIAGSGAWYLVNAGADKDKSDLRAQIDDLSAKVSGTTVTSGDAVTSGATVTSGVATTGSTVADPTAGWNTYTSSTFGFSFKYPVAWNAVWDGGSNSVSVHSPENQAILDKITRGEMYGEGFSPTILLTIQDSSHYYGGSGSNSNNTSLRDFAVAQATPNGVFAEASLGGQNGYELESGGMAGTYYELMTEHLGKVFDFSALAEKQSLSDEQKLVFASFQFTK